MTLTDRDEASFTFLLHGTAEAHAIGSWAKAAFLPPEMFHALLQSLIAEWLEAGSDRVRNRCRRSGRLGRLLRQRGFRSLSERRDSALGPLRVREPGSQGSG